MQQTLDLLDKGRMVTNSKMTKQLFSEMVDKAKAVIQDDFKFDLGGVHVVSGGAAWAGKCCYHLFTLCTHSHPQIMLVVLHTHEDVESVDPTSPSKMGNK